MSKLLLHCIARVDQSEALRSTLIRTAQQWANDGASASSVMIARDEDPLRRSGEGRALPRAFDATLSAVWPESAALEAGLGALVPELAECAHLDLSAALIGRDRIFVACDPAPVRYQYCMRRRPEWSHDAYLVRYAEGHSPIGVRTQGKLGYAQFHVDTAATAAAAQGFGVCGVDSVAQLELESVETFLAAGRENSKLGAIEDEEQFVDRAASVMWVSDVVERFGAKEFQ